VTNLPRWHDIDAQIWKFIDAWQVPQTTPPAAAPAQAGAAPAHAGAAPGQAAGAPGQAAAAAAAPDAAKPLPPDAVPPAVHPGGRDR
jgi:hypothetical protein